MPITLESVAAEHRARVAMRWGQHAHDNALPEDLGDDDSPDLVESMSRNPAKVSDWMGDVASAVTPPDRVIDFAELLVWEQAVTFDGLMTALIGGTQEQAIKAMKLLRGQFQDWAQEKVNG